MITVALVGSDISFLQFRTYSTGTVLLFISFFVLFIVALLLIAFRMIADQRKRELLASRVEFDDNCKRFDLSGNEIKEIKKVVAKLHGLNYNDIFNVQNVYERAIHDEIQQAILNGESEASEAELLYNSIRKKLHFVILPDGIPLTSTRSITSGQPVSIVDYKCDAVITENHETYFVIKIRSDKQVTIPVDSTVTIAFSRTNDGLYAVDVKVIECNSEKIKCRHSITLKRHQLRKDVRMRMPGRLKLYTRDSENNRISFEGKLVDISAGGFCFESDVTIPVNASVYISTSTFPVQVSGVKAVIIASSQREKDDQVINRYHASYVDIPFEIKEKIVSYLFVKMRELQKK